jgi:hypothetical protein
MSEVNRSEESAWPVALMLDEVWLRTRRDLVHALEASSLWPASEPHAVLMKEQRALGSLLGGSLLPDALGERDYLLLNSESVFGPANWRLRTSLPVVLAFGYELGAGLRGLMTTSGEQSREVAELCAVFNLGISIFDLICDQLPSLLGQVTDMMQQFEQDFVSQGVSHWEQFVARSDALSIVELRILLKLIGYFFLRLHDLLRHAGSPSHADHSLNGLGAIEGLLREAYEAELRSAALETSTADIARSKSTLPFTIILEIARIPPRSATRFTHSEAESLMSHLATVFWLTDDLVDLVRDFQTGEANAVLSQARGEPSEDRENAWQPSVLATLLRGSYIERAAGRVCSSLQLAEQALHVCVSADDNTRRFFDLVLSYTRNWME